MAIIHRAQVPNADFRGFPRISVNFKAKVLALFHFCITFASWSLHHDFLSFHGGSTLCFMDFPVILF